MKPVSAAVTEGWIGLFLSCFIFVNWIFLYKSGLLVILNHAGCHWLSSRFLLTCFHVWFCLMRLLFTSQPPCNLGFICDFRLSFEYHINYIVKAFFFYPCRNSAKTQVLPSQQDAEGLIYVWITAQVELLQ